ncbi:hypothetical protein D3C78_1282650 [compost metagenome]
MAHGDAVVDGDGVEFLGHAAGLLDLAGDQLAEVLQVHVAGHELGEGVGDGDDRLLEVLVLHPGGAPQRAGAGHVAAEGGGFRAIVRHGGFPAIRRIRNKDCQDTAIGGWLHRAGAGRTPATRRPARRRPCAMAVRCRGVWRKRCTFLERWRSAGALSWCGGCAQFVGKSNEPP